MQQQGSQGSEDGMPDFGHRLAGKQERVSAMPRTESFGVLSPLCPSGRFHKTARATEKQMPDQEKRFVGEICRLYHTLGSAIKRTGSQLCINDNLWEYLGSPEQSPVSQNEM